MNPDQCIGTGNCVESCPEKDVLGLLSGQATPVSPARCIGHGLCERSCPVNAIELVFGTSRRGVDLPRIQENFETNVPSLYVVGELGGMGLIKNAFEQGRQCIDGISVPSPNDSDVLDLLIVGCGPAGLSCAIQAVEKGFSYRVIEKDGVGGTVLNYPKKKLVMTEPMDLPGTFSMAKRDYAKEELLEIWQGLVDELQIKINEEEIVLTVDRLASGHFSVRTNKDDYTAQNIVLAIGRRGIPRKLDVPGEALPKVAYALKDATDFAGDRVLVVGGGDSAVEAALTLSEQSNTQVHISYRKEAFFRIKTDNQTRLNTAIKAGRIQLIMNSNVSEIRTDQTIIAREKEPDLILPNDFVFIFAGGSLPTEFLNKCGIKIDTVFGARSRPSK
ncbi:MAG: NAD(P)-binding domain-containing protein [Candidatus Latescibacteria bacterium]|nr:NAD(P)-binding domain-containing protein [Candidatus Latescibacterota bacterium]